ncbi:hypothetical protein NGRA_1240 [Nosema granulosis]|uniref:Protein kinase domain-containing protein n=1 Tax=Nosema granulosis TaxID=83296 RepID=A0A9P6KZK0_9MICR|nr:hypothetical protein NGRA_1240 [Nosema granulosis]
MFLKKFFSFSSKTETLIYENQLYKMYSAVQDGKKNIKLVIKNDVKPYDILKKIRHDNILHPIKLNTKHRSITAQFLYPFETVFKTTTTEFNKHIFLCVAKALDFLHTSCSVSHNNIVESSLFFNDDCKIVLGGFEKSCSSSSFDSDNIQFSNLLYKYTGINCTIEKYIKDNDPTNNKNQPNFFFDNEVFFFGFDVHPVETKRDFIRLVRTKDEELVDIYKHRIVSFFIQDLCKDFDKEYKTEILNMIFYMELEDYSSTIEQLFQILDTNVRFYLFKHTDKYISKVSTLDKIIKSLVLGIRCKNHTLRTETFSFLVENHSKLSEASQLEILNTAYEYISDDKGIEQVLDYLNTTKPLFKKSDIVYKILKAYLVDSKKKEKTIEVIQTFYCTFNKYKVSTELLPILCTNLADEKLQNKTFPLIDTILHDLKDHKEQIISREWSFESFKDFFKTRKVKEPQKVEPLQNENKEDIEEDWEEDW